jgi:hypothetical protein
MGATAITFIALFAAVFGVLYIYFITRNKERMALIEKGADASLFTPKRESVRSPLKWGKFTLKIGMLFMGVALGIMVGAIMTDVGILEPGANYPAMIFFFGGLSLVLYYLIDRKNQ